jgi:hypothetical protein
MDMPYSGTLTTILSGMEPAIAIVLACVPPLFKASNSRVDSNRSGYNTSELSGGYGRQKGRSREHSGDIIELFGDDDGDGDGDDNDDNDSQIRLQLVDISKAGISTMSHHKEGPAMPNYSRAITVKKSWAVSSE